MPNCIKAMRYNNKAFTLAEVLITLLIIGVISSLVIPNLINDIQDQQYKVAWKKAYAEISQTAKLVVQDNGGDMAGAYGTTINGGSDCSRNRLANHFLSYMNFTQKCEAGVPTGQGSCWHDANSWYWFYGTKTNASYSDHSRAVLGNGTLIMFRLWAPLCDDTEVPTNDNCAMIHVDINGWKAPNIIGKDIYGMWLLKNGRILPFGSKNDYYYNAPAWYGCDLQLYPNGNGLSCAAKNLQ